jgi:hypothetical protein
MNARRNTIPNTIPMAQHGSADVVPSGAALFKVVALAARFARRRSPRRRVARVNAEHFLFMSLPPAWKSWQKSVKKDS